MFRPVASLDDLWIDEMRGVVVEGKKVLLVRLSDGVCAYEDRCAHLGVPLSEGTLSDGVIRCRVHLYEYDARTGCGVNPKAACLRSYPVRVEEPVITVDVDGGNR